MKKVSNVIPEKSNKMYEEFISTRVLNDKDIIDFIQVNNFTKEDEEAFSEMLKELNSKRDI